jgi:hypothetical protein
MRRLVLRLFALIVIVGQLQWVPAALTCHRQQRQHASHCQDAASTSGPALTVPATGGMGSCASMIGCVPLVPQVVQPVAASLPRGLELATRPMVGAAALRSFVSAPLPPPPQA